MKTTPVYSLAALPALLLAGCNLESTHESDGGTTGNATVDDYETVTLDATAGWAYLSLDRAAEVSASEDWDMAFSRTSVRVNPDRAASVTLTGQNDFYDTSGDAMANIFTNATANSELDHLMASYDLSSVTFATENTDAALGRDGERFYDYSLATHTVSANDDAWWIVRSAGGDSFAKFNVTNASYREGLLSLTADVYVQSSNDSTYNPTAIVWSPTVAAGDRDCFDFDSNASVDCSRSTAWDLKLDVDGRHMMILTNGGASGSGQAAIYGALTDADAALETDGTALSSYVFAQDKGANAITDQPWYAYNLLGGHGIWPNYRVYGIENTQTEEVTFVQLINYYSAADVSGHITVRYRAAD